MPGKISKPTIILSIFSLIILAFTTYATVYEQIISQNNGFFNVIIFGVVLILVFIFITLIARIIGLRPESEQSVFVTYFGYALLLAIFIFFVFFRLRYTSSVPTSESIPFKAASYLYNGNLYEGNEISNNLLYFPANFMYAIRLSLIFKIFGATGKVYVVVNVLLMAFLAAFVFSTVYLISNKTCAYVAVILMLFMPGNSFLVYSYNTELSVAVNFALTYFLYSLLIFKTFKSKVPVIIISVICGIYSGATICAEPVLILPYIVLLIWVIAGKKQPVISCILIPACSAVAVAIFTVIKTSLMRTSFMNVLKGYMQAFNPVYNRKLSETASFSDSYKTFLTRINNPSRFLSENFYFLSSASGGSYSDNQAVWLKLADQLVYIFMLLMCVIMIVYLLRASYTKIIPCLSVFIAAFAAQFLGGINDVSYFYFTTLVIIIGTSTFYYMYLNHHQDYAIAIARAEKNEELAIKMGHKHAETAEKAPEPEQAVDMERARALVFIGENEELYVQIKEQERIDRINNPIAAKRIKSQISETGEYESKVEEIEFLDNLDEKVDVKEVHEVKAIPSTRPVETVKPKIAESYDYDDSDVHEAEVTAAAGISDVAEDERIKADMSNAMPSKLMYNQVSEEAEKPAEPDFINNSFVSAADEYSDAEDKITPDTKSDTSNNNSGYDDFDDTEIEYFDDFDKNANNDLNNFELNDNINEVENNSDDTSEPQSDDEDNKYSVDGFIFRRNVSERQAPENAKSKKALKKEQKFLEKHQKEQLAKNKKAKEQNAKQDKKQGKKQDKKLDKKQAGKVKPGEPLDNPLPLPKPHVSKDMDFDYDVGANDDFDY